MHKDATSLANAILVDVMLASSTASGPRHRWSLLLVLLVQHSAPSSFKLHFLLFISLVSLYCTLPSTAITTLLGCVRSLPSSPRYQHRSVCAVTQLSTATVGLVCGIENSCLTLPTKRASTATIPPFCPTNRGNRSAFLPGKCRSNMTDAQLPVSTLFN